MSYAIITVTTKPADTSWFNLTFPIAARRIGQWIQTQPGFVAASAQRIAPNTSRSIAIFETQAQANAFLAATADNEDWQAREAFKAARGQTSEVTFA
jgi:hypothetical protein